MKYQPRQLILDSCRYVNGDGHMRFKNYDPFKFHSTMKKWILEKLLHLKIWWKQIFSVVFNVSFVKYRFASGKEWKIWNDVKRDIKKMY